MHIMYLLLKISEAIVQTMKIAYFKIHPWEKVSLMEKVFLLSPDVTGECSLLAELPYFLVGDETDRERIWNIPISIENLSSTNTKQH